MMHSVLNDDVNDTESHHQVNHCDDVTVTLSIPGEHNHGRTMPGESKD